MESEELVALKQAFEAWRNSENRGRVIPEELWQRAAILAKKIGVTRVHKELRLSFDSLKKRMGAPKKLVKSRTAFVSLPLSVGPRINDCILKIESASGARMQAELSGIDASGLAQVLREFATS